MRVDIIRIDTGRRVNDFGQVAFVHQPSVGFILSFASTICEGNVHFTESESEQFELLLGAIEARIIRESQSEPSTNVATAVSTLREIAHGGWDDVSDVNCAIHDLRGHK